MQCVMTYGLYLRADGRLPCYCGAGENVTLNTYSPTSEQNFVKDIFNKGLFAHIRNSQEKNLVPFPGVCDQCSYLDLDTPFQREDRVLRWLHIEPSMHCMLDCEWCHGQRDEPAKLQSIDPELVATIVNSFAAEGYRLEKGNICGVGEPLVNKHLWEIISHIKKTIGGDILISTNGNGSYSDAIVPSGVDKIKIAIDSLEQERYQQYREHGSVEKVFDFTRKIAGSRKELHASTPELIWQYIMFNFNDSDDELINLQRKAKNMGVDRLRIVYTRCNNYSRKTRDQFPEEFDNIDFFQIKDESILTAKAASKRFDHACALKHELSLDESAIEFIRLVNDATKRLLLGIDTYKAFLAAVYDLASVVEGTNPSLDKTEGCRLLAIIHQSFKELAELYETKGDTEQAKQYHRFLGQARLELA